MQCEICKKAGMTGNNVSHSNRHTKTRFMARMVKTQPNAGTNLESANGVLGVG